MKKIAFLSGKLGSTFSAEYATYETSILQSGAKIMQNSFSLFPLHLGQLLLYTMASNILLAAILFVVGKTVSWYLLPLSFITGICATAMFYGEKLNQKFAFEICACILLFIVLTGIVGRIYDFSWDGNSYHKLAVGLLKNHWNPLYESPYGLLKESTGVDNSVFWNIVYCKFTWIFGASVYALTGNIESGKVFTLLGITLAFVFTYYLLDQKQNNKLTSILFSAAAALNPVAVSQFDTFYNDGFLQVILFVLIISLFMGLEENSFDVRISASLIAASMIICGNVKFSGLFYGGFFCILFFIIKTVLIYQHDRSGWLKKRIRPFLLYCLLAAITVLWAGNTPYITNFIHFGSPIYPLAGEDTVDIMTINSPFSSENHFKNLFLSLFSRMDNFTISSGKKAVLKIPFTWDWEYEKSLFSAADLRLSGFGMLFSGILLISLLVIIIKMLRMKKSTNFWILFIFTVSCLALSLAIKESWWARYAPYIYFLALTALYILLKGNNLILKICGIVLSGIILVNSCLFFYGLPSEWSQSATIRSSLDALSEEHIAVSSQYGTFPGTYFNLKDKNVYYEIDPELKEDPDAQYFGYWTIVWKPLE